MRAIHARNVNDAYAHASQTIVTDGVREETRNGPALVAPWPVVTVYERPWERVLFHEGRDANPFFHLFESLWMLAGRNDGTWLDRFVKDFSSRYAEPDGTVHGAYGHRWRKHFGVDQLDTIVRLLRDNPSDRQAVLQMWDATADLGVPGLRDRPCNTQVYFRVRNLPSLIDYDNQPQLEKFRGIPDRVLDMTVTCRSNDIVWGCYGANAVHFSVLQEYMAARIGVKIGTYYQLSNNWHLYESVRDKLDLSSFSIGRSNPYESWSSVVTSRPMFPMFRYPEEIDRDIERWFSADDPTDGIYGNPWFNFTAVPMWVAHTRWREGNYGAAFDAANTVEALDWRKAACQWLARRQEKKNA